MRALPLLLALAAAPSPAMAQSAITDAQVRTFMARQEAAWNAGELDRYFAGFTPQARFTDQAYVGDKPPVPYGTSTLAQARTQARKARARAKIRETGRVTRIQIGADGRSARVVSNVASTVDTGGKVRHLCAYRGQALVLRGGRLLTMGQTDTFFKCASR